MEPTSRREQADRKERERVSVEILKAKRKNLSRQKQEMTLKPEKISSLFKVTSSIVITMNLEFNSIVPKEETSPIPLKFIDVMRSTCTDLDVAQEKRIDDYWNVDEDRRWSDSWTGFTKIYAVERGHLQKGKMWSGERLTEIQITTRPDHIWPEAWTRTGEAAQKKNNGQSRSQNSRMPEI